jgi:hypothetical protein
MPTPSFESPPKDAMKQKVRHLHVQPQLCHLTRYSPVLSLSHALFARFPLCSGWKTWVLHVARRTLLKRHLQANQCPSYPGAYAFTLLLWGNRGVNALLLLHISGNLVAICKVVERLAAVQGSRKIPRSLRVTWAVFS